MRRSFLLLKDINNESAMEIKEAVHRLNTLLPLKARQDKLPVTLKNLHQKVLLTLVEQGRQLTHDEIKTVIGNDNIIESVQRLGSDDLVVLGNDKQQIVGAYPVTTEVTSHKITVHKHTIYAMCALDAVSVAPVFNADVVINSVCHISQTPIRIKMIGCDVIEAQPSMDVMIGIRWQNPTSVAAHSLCMEMVFLKDRKTAENWKKSDTNTISIFTLNESVAFGKAYFLPLLND